MNELQSPPASEAKDQVTPPAIGLMVTGGARLILCLSSVFVQLILMFGITGLNTFVQPTHPVSGLVGTLSSGAIGIGFGVIGIAINLFLLYGAMQMRNLKNYSIALAASIVAMVPIFSLSGGCCCLGCFAGVFVLLLSIGSGIWSLIILLKPEVKSAFQS